MVTVVLLSATVAPVAIEVSADSVEMVEGAQVTLQVRCLAERDLIVRGGEVAVVARISYRHKEVGLLGGRFTAPVRRTEVHAEHVLPGPWPLAAHESVVIPVTMPLPRSGLGTARTPLVEITWAFRVRLHVEGYLAAEARRTFVLLTPAATQAEAVTQPAVAESRGCADLRIDALSTRWLAPGGALAGTLAITPTQSCPVRGVRLALVLRQQVHRGEWLAADPARNPAYQEDERDTEVVGVPLAGPLDLDPTAPALPLRLPFRLVAPPDLPAPSLSTPNFTLTWLLRAALDRPLRPDPFVEVPLHGRTTR